MGIFYLISASKSSLVRQFKKGGVEGSVVLYVGGMAELFLSSATEETLYLKKRKGFIKLALQTGVDVVPLYLFGNTTVLSVFKTGFLANLSRKMQVSLTYFWGRWMLPIPKNVKVWFFEIGCTVSRFAPNTRERILCCFCSSFTWEGSLWACRRSKIRRRKILISGTTNIARRSHGFLIPTRSACQLTSIRSS
jgi:Diacylglycerol acyltransferase